MKQKNIDLKQCHLYFIILNLTIYQYQLHELIQIWVELYYSAVPSIFTFNKLDNAPISVPWIYRQIWVEQYKLQAMPSIFTCNKLNSYSQGIFQIFESVTELN